ncbi:hypothetical protein M427DRAFT_47512 [Gonapodya prolifera JEL478]|uniref:Uncharacterized protein n=1 Tax=Gonapodya prolifera (strain JEL478) TaxID=1344416 RepID=A0A139A341_GONPJ|nr:hypothetical protein M427DRAFT_47512 [Gonapodya prolifera JEL478]|eukprot:KXS11089.1 hypothetical protein M427DRAFT_47512 [Gonapodya prolifera JEL478]
MSPSTFPPFLRPDHTSHFIKYAVPIPPANILGTATTLTLSSNPNPDIPCPLVHPYASLAPKNRVNPSKIACPAPLHTIGSARATGASEGDRRVPGSDGRGRGAGDGCAKLEHLEEGFLEGEAKAASSLVGEMRLREVRSAPNGLRRATKAELRGAGRSGWL